MARTPNAKHLEEKRDMILEKSREIFCKKGYLSVTMTDIVKACGISRGGLYLYFSSVEEIFQAVISSRNVRRLAVVRKSIEENAEFLSLLNLYFDMQKERLLNMEQSFLMATYEYYSVNNNPDIIKFRDSQIALIKQTILDIFELGIKQGIIENNNIEEALAEHYVLMIEGMSVFGSFKNITSKQIDTQIELMKNMLKFKRKG